MQAMLKNSIVNNKIDSFIIYLSYMYFTKKCNNQKSDYYPWCSTKKSSSITLCQRFNIAREALRLKILATSYIYKAIILKYSLISLNDKL